ncbi:Jasmonate O-methyltransferase [Acorus calamus]|uniref:Jasmonate O-methyltransferase n=1 Tax=Acorus calamus TaxID=4465 RepID=A0AAV9FLV2_ACOCL|nr:Jasmonate O-methyltransferase [Acorus calamus]
MPLKSSEGMVSEKSIISIAKEEMKEAILDVYCATFPERLNIADLGCSAGPTAILPISEVVDVVDQKRRQLGHPPMEFLWFLNDLPQNDFNTVFKTLPEFYEKLESKKGKDHSPCFIVGVPGSFHGRLFPKRSLHFVISSTSLHWLSQGGRMVLTMMGRKADDPSDEDVCYGWIIMAKALKDMVSEKNIISITREVMKEAILDVYCATFPERLNIADLGCSSGPNAVLAISEVMDVVDQNRRRLGRPPTEFQCFLNDLPWNDFNTVFKTLPEFYDKLDREKGSDHSPCFIVGVPGSFYGRLFP